LLKQTVGWLSWLGTSQAWTEAKQVYSGDYITYTTVLRHDGVEDIKSAKFTGHFPDYLIPDQAGLQDRVRIAGNDIVWQGPLHQNQMLTFTYRVRVSENAPYGVKSRHAVEIAYDDHDVKFDRLLDVPVNIPVWTSSTLTVTPSQAALQERLTYTLELINDSVVDVPMLTVTTRVPDHLSIATGNGTMDPGGLGPIGEVGTVLLGDSSLTWLTPVSAGERLRLGYQAQVIQRPYPFTFPVTFEADDGYTKTTWTAYAYIEPAQVYLPIIQK